MKIKVQAQLQRDQGFRLDLKIDCETSSLGVVGESGSGKSTLLDMLSGVIPGAQVQLDDHDYSTLPVHQRAFGYVTQDPLLFPHMDVRANLLYSPRAGSGFDDVVGALDIAHVMDRFPRNLSGGEKRRVSLARALLSQPRLLLLDEPFAGLDEERRRAAASLLNELRVQFDLPVILVSHLAGEVMSLTEQALRLEKGCVTAHGASYLVLGERDLRVDNFMRGQVVARDRIRVDNTELSVMLPEGMRGEVRLVCYAHDVMLARTRPQDVSSRNIFAVRVLKLEAAGAGVFVQLDSPHIKAFITRATAEEMGVQEGAELFALIKATSILPLH